MLSSGVSLKALSAKGRKGKWRSRNGARRQGRVIFPLLLVCAIVVTALVGADYWLHHGKIYPGVWAKGVNLGDKTPEEAQKILEERTGGLKEIRLTGPQEFSVSSKDVGVDFDVQASVDQAYSVGRRGGIPKRISERIEAIWGTVPVPLVVHYDSERLRSGLSGVTATLAADTVEAEFKVNGSEVSVTPSQTGRQVDEEKLLADIEVGLFEGKSEYEVPIITEEPKLTTEEAESLKPTTLLARYRTDSRETSDKSEERVENLEIASGAVDGTLLAPGEVFSLTEKTDSLDYNKTKVIYEGKEEKADGGGLCQVSSTIYMAANYAGLEIVERHPHYAQLPYIRPGFDATIWFESLDMKFKNDTDSYVLVREWVADDEYVYAEIWGQPTGRTVEMDSEPEYVGSDYSKWVTYKKVKENGEDIFDGVLHKDVYKPLVDEKGKIIRPDSEEAKPAPANP